MREPMQHGGSKDETSRNRFLAWLRTWTGQRRAGGTLRLEVQEHSGKGSHGPDAHHTAGGVVARLMCPLVLPVGFGRAGVPARLDWEGG